MIIEVAGIDTFSSYSWDLPVPKNDASAKYTESFSVRHGGGSHIVWFDGHVTFSTYAEFSTMVHDPSSPWKGDVWGHYLIGAW